MYPMDAPPEPEDAMSTSPGCPVTATQADDMAARPLDSLHSPAVPSPLNPASTASSARRRNSRSARRNTGMSPAQRLLRQKAAEAWRSQALSREVAWYERRAVEAITAKKRKVATLRPEKPLRDETSHARLGSLRYGNAVDVDMTDKYHPQPQAQHQQRHHQQRHHQERQELEQQQHDQQYRFQMPDLGFFTPRRVVVAIGMMRMLPSLRQNFLRCADTS